MISITNGNAILEVTVGAFKNFYEYRGFKRISVPEHSIPPMEVSTPSEEEPGREEEFVQETEEDTGELETYSEESEEEIDLSEIPLSEMSFDQLCERADQLGLNRDRIRSKKELRNLIRSSMN